MNREFDTPTLDWLHDVYEERKRRAFDLGKQATDLLIKESKKVSHRAVAQRSKEIDPDGNGIHVNTIRSNKELHEYISQNSAKKYPAARRAAIVRQETNFKLVKEERDLERVRNRYMKLTKVELVELLIQTEQYIAQNNKRWLKDAFEKHQ